MEINEDLNLFIDEKHFQTYLEMDKKDYFLTYLNNKQFTATDSFLTHRQILLLDKDGLLDYDRKTSTEWRKFSFIDLVYQKILLDLKKYGIQHEMLNQFRDTFFKKGKVDLQNTTYDVVIGEVAIGCVFTGIEILLCFNADGKTILFDPVHFIAKSSFYFDGFITLSLSSIVNEVRNKTKSEIIDIRFNLHDTLLKPNDLTKREKAVLIMLRKNEFESIEIQKRKDQSWFCIATKKQDNKKIEIEDIKKLIEENPFLDIQFKIDNGKIQYQKISLKLIYEG